MNDNEVVVNDEQNNIETTECQNKQKNSYGGASIILCSISFVLTVVLLVFGFLHLAINNNQGQAITEFIFAIVGAVITVFIVLLSSVGTKTNNKHIILIIGNSVCMVMLAMVIMFGINVGFKNANENSVTPNSIPSIEENVKDTTISEQEQQEIQEALKIEAEKEQAWRSCMELQLWNYTVEQLMYWVFEDYEVDIRNTSGGVYEVEISGRYYPYYMQKHIVQEGSIIFIVDLYAEGSPAYISDKEKDVAKAFEFAAVNMTY
ncbi:MAG: APC family permease [Clostridia bacterium]|nr:APC family permease [Clostridia bacterium]